jgi:hypothetical protein
MHTESAGHSAPPQSNVGTQQANGPASVLPHPSCRYPPRPVSEPGIAANPGGHDTVGGKPTGSVHMPPIEAHIDDVGPGASVRAASGEIPASKDEASVGPASTEGSPHAGTRAHTSTGTSSREPIGRSAQTKPSGHARIGALEVEAVGQIGGAVEAADDHAIGAVAADAGLDVRAVFGTVVDRGRGTAREREREDDGAADEQARTHEDLRALRACARRWRRGSAAGHESGARACTAAAAHVVTHRPGARRRPRAGRDAAATRRTRAP